MKTAYLGLGSNLADRAALLKQALHRLQELGVEVRRVSSTYETAPVGLTEQPDFLNLVVEIGSSLPPRELLARCLEVEAALGRVRRERWGPRTLDIDLLWHEDGAMASPDLTLPHPRMTERAFVMVPLAEIAPDLRVGGQTASAWALRLQSQPVRKVGAPPAEEGRS